MLKMSEMSFSFSLNVNAIYVEDVKDRWNTPKGCNAMYVKDVEGGKGTYKHISVITFLIFNWFSIRKKFWKNVEDVKDYLTFNIFNMLQHTRDLMVWLESSKSQLSKTFLDWKSIKY